MWSLKHFRKKVEDSYMVDSFADAFEAVIKDDDQVNLTQPLSPVIIPTSVPLKFFHL